MAGHMGAEQATVQSLEVAAIDPDKNFLMVRGAVPGAEKGWLLINKASKRK